MNPEMIKATVTDIFKRVFKDPGLVLTDSMTAHDVAAWDSLNHLVLMSEIEGHFKIKFKLRELLGIENVGDLLNAVTAKTTHGA